MALASGVCRAMVVGSALGVGLWSGGGGCVADAREEARRCYRPVLGLPACVIMCCLFTCSLGSVVVRSVAVLADQPMCCRCPAQLSSAERPGRLLRLAFSMVAWGMKGAARRHQAASGWLPAGALSKTRVCGVGSELSPGTGLRDRPIRPLQIRWTIAAPRAAHRPPLSRFRVDQRQHHEYGPPPSWSIATTLTKHKPH